MLIDRVNLNNLRVFECVYKTRCMTTASKELHLTQSGVSQHMKGLEQTLGVRLFDRINKRIIPTEEGEKLYQICRPALFTIEEALTDISDQKDQITGFVNIGMPIEFGNNVVIPQLSELGRQFKGLKFNLTLGFASDMNDLLLSGKLDFAFVDNFTMDRRIFVEKVGEEIFELVATKKYLESFGETKNAKAYFEQLNYVAYQDEEPILRSWFTHHLKRKNLSLKVKAQVMDVQGNAQFILNHMGVGILPDHLVKKLIADGTDIHVFEGCGKPMKNHMSLAYLKQRSRAPHVMMVLNELKDCLAPSNT